MHHTDEGNKLYSHILQKRYSKNFEKLSVEKFLGKSFKVAGCRHASLLKKKATADVFLNFLKTFRTVVLLDNYDQIFLNKIITN